MCNTFCLNPAVKLIIKQDCITGIAKRIRMKQELNAVLGSTLRIWVAMLPIGLHFTISAKLQQCSGILILPFSYIDLFIITDCFHSISLYRNMQFSTVRDKFFYSIKLVNQSTQPLSNGMKKAVFELRLLFVFILMIIFRFIDCRNTDKRAVRRTILQHDCISSDFGIVADRDIA